MARLRAPGGCPWDREQTHRSLRPYLIEECYEACDAIDQRDDSALQEELGDVLLQVVFHAQLAAEAGKFDIDDIAAGISEKLVRRHPHVFGKDKLRTSDEVLKQWDVIKKGEKPSLPASALAGVPRSLPALQKAEKIQRKAAKVGFDWRNADDVLAKIEEELQELKVAKQTGNRRHYAEELGDILFAVVNLARFEKFEAEELLNGTTRKFIRRFEHIEKAVRREGRQLEECTLEELDAHWEAAKKKAKSAPRSRGSRGR
jgi:MazG family protein